MTSIVQYPDVPCSYPTTLGANVSTAIGNTPKVLAVFRNESTIDSLRGIMQRFDFTPLNPSADTLVTIQLVGGGTAVGGAWSAVGTPSLLDINTTMTGYSGGIVGVTVYSSASASHGNTPPAASLSNIDAESLGLILYKHQQFAIIASTRAAGATVNLAWAVNWLEKD